MSCDKLWTKGLSSFQSLTLSTHSLIYVSSFQSLTDLLSSHLSVLFLLPSYWTTPSSFGTFWGSMSGQWRRAALVELDVLIRGYRMMASSRLLELARTTLCEIDLTLVGKLHPRALAAAAFHFAARVARIRIPMDHEDLGLSAPVVEAAALAVTTHHVSRCTADLLGEANQDRKAKEEKKREDADCIKAVATFASFSRYGPFAGCTPTPPSPPSLMLSVDEIVEMFN